MRTIEKYLPEEIKDQVETSKRHWLDKIKDNTEDNEIKISIKILMIPTTSSSKSAAIVSYAEQNNIDLIIVGTRGRSGFKKNATWCKFFIIR
jgi:nucleotide-binding universal stress UspA family protein